MKLGGMALQGSTFTPKHMFLLSYNAITQLCPDWHYWYTILFLRSVCKVGKVGMTPDYQPEGFWVNPWPGQGLNFGRASFATLSMDRDIKLLV